METWIKIEMDNSAFVDNDNQGSEVARILRKLAGYIDGHSHFSPGHDQALRDYNGNEVGFCGVYPAAKILTERY